MAQPQQQRTILPLLQNWQWTVRQSQLILWETNTSGSNRFRQKGHCWRSTFFFLVSGGANKLLATEGAAGAPVLLLLLLLLRLLFVEEEEADEADKAEGVVWPPLFFCCFNMALVLRTSS